MRRRSNLHKSRHAPWIMWGVAAIFYFYQFVVRVSPNVMTPQLMQTFGVDACSLGVLATFYYYSYAALQLPIGIFADYFGPRKFIAFSAGLTAVGLLCFSFSHSLFVAQICRLIIGAGSAGGFIGCLKLASLWFPPERFGRVIGLTMVLGTLGGTFGGAPLAYFIGMFGWREVILGLAVVGFFIMFIIWYIIEDRPHSQEVSLEKEQPKLFKGLKRIVKDSQSWLIIIYGFCTYMPLTVFGDLWGVSFLESAYKVDHVVVASAVSMMFLGLATGAPLFTTLAEKPSRRRFLLTLTPLLIASWTGIIVLFAGQIPFYMMYALFYLTGVSIGGHYLNFIILCERHSRDNSGAATGFSNGSTMAFAFLIQPFIGKILDLSKGKKILEGVTLFSLEGYQSALSIVPTLIFGALFITFFIKVRKK